ncbi:MAG: GNAT family N-acetyltransferase [Bacteroidota bacterium]
MQLHIQNEPDARREDELYVLDQLKIHNSAHAPVPFERLRLRLFARDENGTILGGLVGSVTFHWLKIDILWVDEKCRGKHLGAKLVKEAERMAVEVGAHSANVETTTFQARPFYEKMGYEVFAELPDYPTGASTFFLKKEGIGKK